MGKHRLDKLFADKLEGLEYQPQNASWNEINDSLDRKSSKALWSWLGVAASVLLAVFAIWYLVDTQDTNISQDYALMEQPNNDIYLPAKVILVPVIIGIQTPEIVVNTNPVEEESNILIPPNPILDKQENKKPMVLATNDSPENTTNPVITDPLIPETDIDESQVIATNIDTDTESESKLVPVTIIYKQGNKEDKTNFEKAYAYLEEVSRGEKRLLDFKRIGENLRSKFNTTEANSP